LTAEIIIAADDASSGLPEILFRSDHIEVRRIGVGDGRHQVVTFESYHDDPGFDRTGFGEGFFARAGFTAIHVLSVGNDWYQYPEMDDVLDVIRTAVSGADRVLTYGSSMGGYAAVRFADAVGATHVLSLSPQYSIDPRVVAADKRWWWDQKRIDFLPVFNGTIGCRSDVVIAYDPTLKLDKLHADLIGRDIPARLLPFPYGGHPVTTVLGELGLLQTMAINSLAGVLELAAIQGEFEARREEASMWLAEYSSRLPEGDKARACELSARAAAMAPGNATIQHQYGMRLHDLGQYEQAIVAHGMAVAISPHPIFVLSLSRSLFFAGRFEEAAVNAERALAERAFDSEYYRWAARARRAVGNAAGAYHHALSAFRLSRTPRNFLSVLRYGFGVLRAG
jgi:hypothetical protein